MVNSLSQQNICTEPHLRDQETWILVSALLLKSHVGLGERGGVGSYGTSLSETQFSIIFK